MNVTLREISAETVADVMRLAVKPEQQRFVASNTFSLGEALFSEMAWYRAVYEDENLVGFVMLRDESIAKNPPEAPSIGLWRLMVDHRFQGRGIGRRVVEQVVNHAVRKNRFTGLFTSYIPGPAGPEGFYLSLGFVPNGDVKDNETVALLRLAPSAA